MSSSPPSTEHVAAFRARQKLLGRTRTDIYLDADTKKRIKALANAQNQDTADTLHACLVLGLSCLENQVVFVPDTSRSAGHPLRTALSTHSEAFALNSVGVSEAASDMANSLTDRAGSHELSQASAAPALSLFAEFIQQRKQKSANPAPRDQNGSGLPPQ